MRYQNTCTYRLYADKQNHYYYIYECLFCRDYF